MSPDLSPHPLIHSNPPHGQLIPIFSMHIDLPIDSELSVAAIPKPSNHPRQRNSAPLNPHPITTRARDGIFKLKVYIAKLKPSSVKQALSIPHWK